MEGVASNRGTSFGPLNSSFPLACSILNFQWPPEVSSSFNYASLPFIAKILNLRFLSEQANSMIGTPEANSFSYWFAELLCSTKNLPFAIRSIVPLNFSFTLKICGSLKAVRCGGSSECSLLETSLGKQIFLCAV